MPRIVRTSSSPGSSPSPARSDRRQLRGCRRRWPASHPNPRPDAPPSPGRATTSSRPGDQRGRLLHAEQSNAAVDGFPIELVVGSDPCGKSARALRGTARCGGPPQRAKIAKSMSELVVDPVYRRSAKAAPQSLLVIANSNASGHARLDPLLTALHRLGARVELARTSDVAELAAVWAQAPAERIVLVGGDGTLHAAVNLPGPPRDIALCPPAGRTTSRQPRQYVLVQRQYRIARRVRRRVARRGQPLRDGAGPRPGRRRWRSGSCAGRPPPTALDRRSPGRPDGRSRSAPACAGPRRRRWRSPRGG